MNKVDQALIDRMGIDDREIEQRKDLVGLQRDHIPLLINAGKLIEPVIYDIIVAFFSQIAAKNAIAGFGLNVDMFQRLHDRMEQYLLDLFSGKYDREYVYNRVHIGLMHQRSGITPKLYLSAMKGLRDILRRHVAQQIRPHESGLSTWNALDALLSLDSLFVLDTYFYGLIAEIDEAKQEVEHYARTLEEKVSLRTRQLEELSRRDSLTGLYNHRAFTEYLRRYLALAIRNNSPLCLVYMDVDDFKYVNDELGHYEGDEVLKRLGWILMGVSRESDIACRYGGDEFCVILPDSIVAQAKIYCQRVMSEFTKEFRSVTVSFGIVQTGPDKHLDMDSLIKRADKLMYEAKRSSGQHVMAEHV
ncbi:MAG: GGDEF domain-containing protein [Candidatus Zixiibacteriota bacterium]